METKKTTNRKTITRITIDKIISIKVSEQRFEQMKSGRHFEFNRVRIPPEKQGRLKIGDTIYANGADGKSKALEFLTLERQSGYDEDQVDMIVRVI
jgi:hypothetical protein